MPVGGHAPLACPGKWSVAMPAGTLLQTSQVDAEQSDRAQEYALDEPQTGEVRVYLAEDLLDTPMLARQLMELTPEQQASIDIVMLDPQPDPVDVVAAANQHAVAIRVPRGGAPGFDPDVLEFVDGFGPMPLPFATAALVFPADVLEERDGTDQVANRFGVAPGAEPGTYDLGDDWVVQVFDWGVWVRPAAVPAGVADEVRRRYGRPADSRPLVVVGVRGGAVADSVLRRIDELRSQLPPQLLARLRLRWLGERPRRPARTAATAPAGAVHLDPGPRSGLDGSAGRQLAQHLSAVGARALVVHAFAGRVVYEDRLYDAAGLAGIVPRTDDDGPLLLVSSLSGTARLSPDYAARFAVLRGADVIEVPGLGFRGPGGTVSVTPPADGPPPALAVPQGTTVTRYRADGGGPQPLLPDLLNALIEADLTPHRPAEPPVGPAPAIAETLDPDLAALSARTGREPADLSALAHLAGTTPAVLAALDPAAPPPGDPFGGADLSGGLRQRWFSAQLGVPVEELAGLRVDLDALVALAATLPGGPGSLVRFVLDTRRIPAELPGLVQRWGVDADRLLREAVRWNVDPAALAPMRHPSEAIDQTHSLWREWFHGGDRGSALALLTDLDLTFADAWSSWTSEDLAERWWEWLWGPDRVQTVSVGPWTALAQGLRAFAAAAFAAQANDPQLLHRLAARAGVSPTLLAMYSLSIGRVPDDLFDLAAAARVHPGRLLALASLLGTDIRSLAGPDQLAALARRNDDSRQRAVLATAAEFGGEHGSTLPRPGSQFMDDLAATIARHGRVPTDLFRLAGELDSGISPAVLLRVSADLDADPHVVAQTLKHLGTTVEPSPAAIVERYHQWAAERGLTPDELKPFLAWLDEPERAGRLPDELGALVDEWILGTAPEGGLDDTVEQMRARLREAGTDLLTVRTTAAAWKARLGALYAVTVSIGRLPIEVPDLAAMRGSAIGWLLDLMHVTKQHPLAVRVLLTDKHIVRHSGRPARLLEVADHAGQQWHSALLSRGEQAGLTAVQLREILADLDVRLDEAATDDELKTLRQDWISLVLGDAHGAQYQQLFDSLQPLRDLVERRVDEAGLDRLGIERLARSSGLSSTLIAAFSLRIGRVPVELADWTRLGSAGDGRLLLLAVLLGVDPGGPAREELRQLLDELPSGERSPSGPGAAARAAMARRRDDPEWQRRHPPERAFGADLMNVIRLADRLRLQPDEVVPFVAWLARDGRGPADLAGMQDVLVGSMRLEWLAAEFDADESSIQDDLDRHPWLRHTQALLLAERLDVPPAEVRTWSLRFRQVPMDLDERAQRLRLPERMLWHLVTDLGIDPWALEPLLAGLVRPGRRVDRDALAAAVRAYLQDRAAALGVPAGVVLAFVLDTRPSASSGAARMTRDDLDAWAGMLLGRHGTADTHALGRPVTAADLEPLSWFAEAFDRDGELTRAARQIAISPLWLVLTSIRVRRPLVGLPEKAEEYGMTSTRQLLALISAHGSDLPPSQREKPNVMARYRRLPQTGYPYQEAWELARTLRTRDRTDGDLPPYASLLRPFLDLVLKYEVGHDTSVRLAERIMTAELTGDDLDGLVRGRLSDIWAQEWAVQHALPEEAVARDLRRHDWLTPAAVESLAARLGADPLKIWAFAVWFRRLPTGLDDLAAARGLDAVNLYWIAFMLEVDTHDLSPVLKVYDPERPLATQLQEWTDRLGGWSAVRADRSTLVLALHGLGLSLDWPGSVDDLRDMVDDWLAATIGTDRTTLRDLERAAPLDLPAAWDTVRRIAERTGGDNGRPRDLDRLAARLDLPVVWLRGVLVRTGISPADVAAAASGGGADVAALLALAAALGRPPAHLGLTSQQTARLVTDPAAGWWPAVKLVAAELPAGTTARTGEPVTEAEAFIELLRAGVSATLERVEQLVGHLRGYAIPLLDLPVEIRAGYVRLWNGRDTTGATTSQQRDDLMTLLLTRVAGDWRLLPGPDEQNLVLAPARVVHAGVSGPAGPPGPAETVLYLWLTLPGPQVVTPAPPGTRFSRAVGFDRFLGTAGSLPADDPRNGIRLGDTGGMFLEDLLAAYPGRGFVRFRLPGGGSAQGFDGVVRHIRWKRHGRGIVLYRVAGVAGSTTGVLNVYRGPSDEVVFLDALTFAPARLPAADTVDALFLDTTPQAQTPRGADPADPREEAWDWQDQLSEWAAAFGIDRADAYRIATDSGVQDGWSGDFAAVKERWEATALGLTPQLYRKLRALPAAEQDHMRQSLQYLVGENGWTGGEVSKTATALGVSPEWLHGAVLLTGARPADVIDHQHRHDPRLRRAKLALAVQLRRAPASFELTDDQVKRLSTPAGWFAAVTRTAGQLRSAGSAPVAKANTQVFHLVPLHTMDRFEDETFDRTQNYLDELAELRDHANAESVDFAALSQDVLRAYLQYVSQQDVNALAGAVLREAADGWTLPDGRSVRVVHGSAAGPALALLLDKLGLPRPGSDGVRGVPGGPGSAGVPVARALAVDAWYRSPSSGRRHFQTEERSLGELVEHYPDAGGFVRLLGPNRRRVPGFTAAVAHLAATGGSGILLHRSLDDTGRGVQAVLNAIAVDGAVILLDPVTLAPAVLPTGRPVDVLLLRTSADAPAGGTEPVDADAAWAPTFADLFPPVPLVLPPGAAEIDGALLVGDHTTDDPQRKRIIELTTGLRSPVVILDARSGRENLATLATLLERLRLQGRRPVVVHPATLTPPLRDLGAAHGVVLVHKAPPAGSLTIARLDNVWAVTGPGRDPALYGEQPTRQVFEAAATMSAPLPQRAPTALAEWLNAAAAGDRSESQRLLGVQLGDLAQPAVRAWLDGMAARAVPGDHTAAIHAALLDLAGLGAADHGYRFLAAPDPAARMEAALQAPTGGLEPLVRLARATAKGRPVDEADAAVLDAVWHILTTDSPTPQVFDEERIQRLSRAERVEWENRLYRIGTPFSDGSTQKAALAVLQRMTLEC
ncbi:hypothetical protein [Dactylosporangium sp. CA-233914]|uniref:hypothetical protein n=1 Tax=Dactylosporangium sp. CA-233914 TaxID=3239934 RepID=UPI003D8DE63F